MNSRQVTALLEETPIDSYMLNQWYPIPDSDLIPQGPNYVVKTILGRELILWRNGDEIVARRNHCPHEHHAFSNDNPNTQPKIEDACIQCPAHGWKYNEQGMSGRPPSSPERQANKKWRIEVYPVVRKYGFDWICMGDNPGEIPAFSEYETHRLIACGPYKAETSWALVLANLINVSHFFVAHAASQLGDPSRPEIPDYEVRIEGGTLYLENVRVWQKNSDGSNVPGWAKYSFRVTPPHVHFVKHLEAGEFVMLFALTPAGGATAADDETSCVLFPWMAVNYDPGSDNEVEGFQDRVWEEDKGLLNNARIRRLPLIPQLGYPTIPADKAILALKDLLRRHGVTYGVTTQDFEQLA